jgi:hypothetical protein
MIIKTEEKLDHANMQKYKSSRIMVITLYIHSANVNLVGFVSFVQDGLRPSGFGITSEPKPTGSRPPPPNVCEEYVRAY